MDSIKITTNTKWKVGLNNGENFIEGFNQFEIIKGEKSPWLKLQDYIAENSLKITSLALITRDQRTFNLPSAGNNPKFRAFQEIEKPIDFKFFRMVGSNLDNTNNDLFAVIEAIYPNYKLQLWVDENNTKNSWVLMKGGVII